MTTVRFLGSGDAFGSGGRLQTCILLQDGDWRGLLDCGATSLSAMKGAGVDPSSIDTVVVTHLHGDHFGGLPFLVLDAQFNSRRSTPLTLVGHADLEPRLRAAMDILFPGSARALDTIDVRFVTIEPPTTTRLGEVTIQPFEVVHFCGTPPFALRLTTPAGTVISYSGDTEWTESLVAAADGADLFIAEAYFYDKPVRWHLDYVTLRRNAGRLNARRIIATHLGADMVGRLDEVALDTAHDGLSIELRPGHGHDRATDVAT